jgi:hypothetical protein
MERESRRERLARWDSGARTRKRRLRDSRVLALVLARESDERRTDHWERLAVYELGWRGRA